MSSVSSEKKTIILSLGPLHLFWTTGIYYLYELSQAYNVILIAWDSYERNLDFQQAIAKFNVSEIIYIPVGGSFRRNWFEARVFRDLSNRHKISLVFQHTYVCEDNLYLQCLIRRKQPNCKFITYQNGMQTVGSSADDFRARMAIGISDVSSRYGLSFIMASWLYTARIRILYFANFIMFPFLFVGTILRPEINVYTGERPRRYTKRHNRPPRDYITAYTKEEIKAYRSRPESSMFTCVLIRHPLETIGKECNLLIYGPGDVDESNFIVLLPSAGTVDTLLYSGTSADHVINDVAEKWNKVIVVLRKVYPDYRIIWKLHPGSATNRLHLNIQNRVSNSNSFLEVVDAESNAQQWILHAKVIVSEVSTVLWWASFFPGKTAISLDVFNYKSGDEMKYHTGIKYCDNLRKLKNILIQQAKFDHTRDYPTLSAFLQSISR